MRHFFLFIFTVLFLKSTFSQGCSDAGFCTLDGIKTHKSNSEGDVQPLKNAVKLGASLGSTRYKVGILTPYAEFVHRFKNNFNLSVRLLASSRFGDYANTFDLSDAFVTGNLKLSQRISLIVGTKIPFSRADKSYNGIPLPMAYQSSLGTYDAILGSSWVSKNWLFVAAWQQPINQNSNSYFAGVSPDQSQGEYLSTNKFERAGDILLRISYLQKPMGRNKKLQFTYSILPVYHLQNDTYEDINGQRQTLDNSQGLTLNLNIFANYKLNESSFLELILGAPVVAREVRPEGLPQFALGVEFTKRF